MTGETTGGRVAPQGARVLRAPADNDGRVDFAIIGAQKSASTFLQHCLAAHPQIALASTESPHFEDPVYSAVSMAALTASFQAAPPGSRLGIKRPNYLGLPEVPGRLARHAPDARLLAVLRDPAARAVSAYRHYVTAGRVAHAPIDAGFRRLLDGAADRDHPYAAEILDWGRYGEHLDRYLSHFPPEQLLLVLQDDIVEAPARVFAEAYRFLDVDDSFVPPGLHGRRNVGAQSELHLRLSQARWQARQRYLAGRAGSSRRPANALAWPYVATLTVLDRYVLPRIPGHLDQLSATTLAELRDYYADDVRHVADILGRDLAMWS